MSNVILKLKDDHLEFILLCQCLHRSSQISIEVFISIRFHVRLISSDVTCLHLYLLMDVANASFLLKLIFDV